MLVAERQDLTGLSSAQLARRLVELAGEERHAQVEFLLHLDEFDRRRGWLVAGHESLWAYCRQALHLREGAASRRIGAMRALRRIPALEPALRDGRLCLTTVNLLAPVLTPDNVHELVAQSAFLSKADTQRLVVTLQPRLAPREGVRLLPGGPRGNPELELVTAPRPVGAEAGGGASGPAAVDPPLQPPARGSAEGTGDGARADVPPPPRTTGTVPAARAEVRPVDALSYSLRVTLGAAAKADLDRLVDLLSHKTGRDLAAVVHEAIRCALEKHGKRRGAVVPGRRASAGGRSPGARASGRFAPRTVTAEVKREVHERDGGRCTYVSPDGRRCGSRWKLEFHHLDPVARGGAATVENITLRCKPHNLLAAEQDFGAEHVRRFTHREPTVPTVREEVAWYGGMAPVLAMGPAP